MNDRLALGLIIAALAFAAWTLVTALRNKPPGDIELLAAAALELAVLAQVALAVVQIVRGERPGELATFIGYLVGSVLILPIAVLWALAERTRWSSVVLGVAFLVIVVVILRMQVVWGTHA